MAIYLLIQLRIQTEADRPIDITGLVYLLFSNFGSIQFRQRFRSRLELTARGFPIRLLYWSCCRDATTSLY